MRCRTCFEAVLESQRHALHDIVSNQKTLAEVILEIAKFDTNDFADLEFNFLCNACYEKTKAAYEFILQARKFNEQLKLYANHSGFLDEIPIDAETMLEIKPDIESLVFDGHDILSADVIKEEKLPAIAAANAEDAVARRSKRVCRAILALDQLEEADDYNATANLKEDEDELPLAQSIKRRGRPRRNERVYDATATTDSHRKCKTKLKKNKLESCSDEEASKDSSTDFEINAAGVESNSDEFSSTSQQDWSDEIPKKKRKVYKTRKRENVCSVCGKAYVKHKELINHVKEHAIEPQFSCDYCDNFYLEKSKLLAHMKVHEKLWLNDKHKREPNAIELNYIKNLYEKQNMKLIQCKLCNRNFERIAALRKHIISHEDAKTILTKHLTAAGEELSEEFKQKISKDIKQQKFIDYYVIVNENGYEICISESDVTDDDDLEVNELNKHEDEKALSELRRRSQYKCLLCKQTFDRKYKMFKHNLEAHTNEIHPLKCSVCKFNFVSHKMLQQHVRRQCRNKAKMLKCAHCPGKFRWHENSINHNCPNPFNNPTRQYNRQKKVRSLKCEHCEKIFIWAKDLQRHMRIHVDESEKLKCVFCKRNFNRKDNLKKHLKIHHGDEETITLALNQLKYEKRTLVKAVSEFLKRPHGCKIVECLICQLKQLRKSDLKAHLLQHQHDCAAYMDRWESMEVMSETLYPELTRPLDNETTLIERIKNDLAAANDDELQRFYSILDENGYEMNLESSETETDTDADDEDNDGGDDKRKKQILSKYICEICNATFERKFKIFEHQSQQHQWHEAKHQCTICGARFVSAQLLNWHGKRQCQNALKRFVCRKCPLRFMRKQNRLTHMQSAHATVMKLETNNGGGNSNNFNCALCKRKFSNKNALERHQQICGVAANAAILKCFYCPRKFYRYENLQAHLLRHNVTAVEIPNAETIIKATTKSNGVKKIYCRICNLTFQTIAALRTHLLHETTTTTANSTKTSTCAHYNFESPLNYVIINSLGFEMDINDSETDANDGVDNELEETKLNDAASSATYQCALCTLQTKRKFQMAQHQLSYHKYEELPFRCEQCVFRSVCKTILDQHLRTQCLDEHKQNVCNVCRYKFMWPENLEAHKKITNHVDGAEKCESMQKIYHCQQCSTKHSSKKQLNAHNKRMHQSAKTATATSAVSATADIAVPNREMNYLCPICGMRLSSNANLVRHTRVHHTHEKPYQCDFCEKTFSCKSAVLNHRKVHSDEKPFACTICNRAFARNKGLAVHMRTHTGERPHKCPYCEKSFGTYSSLSVHRRRHTGERPYVCYCGASFIKNELLRRHRNSLGHQENAANAPTGLK